MRRASLLECRQHVGDDVEFALDRFVDAFDEVLYEPAATPERLRKAVVKYEELRNAMARRAIRRLRDVLGEDSQAF